MPVPNDTTIISPVTDSGFRELTVCCTPEGVWQLEWEPRETPSPQHSLRLQEMLAGSADGDAWLVRLAFADRAVVLSPSLHFLRSFFSAFADWMRHTPEIEALHASLVCPVPSDALKSA